MALTSTQIVAKIRNYVGNSLDKIRGHWYVGITKNINKRLFDDHRVDSKNGPYIYCQAISVDEARNAESELLNLGYDGGTGGGDEATVYVYTFLKTSYTDPARSE